MIPHLCAQLPPSSDYQRYLLELTQRGFQGEVSVDLARRLVGSTDNSVYQLLPEAIIYPKNTEDVCLALLLLDDPRFHRVRISPRGGGTGTNGQSLTRGVSLDLSRHMNRILEVNPEEGWARVQAGVVLDQLNDSIRPHGLFFAPNLSPSNRATIGGMINTDAAGKGSRIYGKTSDHLISLETILIGGEPLHSEQLSQRELELLISSLDDDQSVDHPRDQQNKYAQLCKSLYHIVQRDALLIEKTFPKLSRFMTGYNLQMLSSQMLSSQILSSKGEEGEECFDLNRLLSGSEGTLGVITEATVQLVPIPKARRLILLKYSRFQDALGSAQLLLSQDPSAIETIDETILDLARKDLIYHRVRSALESRTSSENTSSENTSSENTSQKTAAINLLEFQGESEDEVEGKVSACLEKLRPHYGEVDAPIGAYVASSPEESSALWELRKKGVGLLAARPGKRKPIAFVEDTVVPPEHLREYIEQFTALLDAEGVEYGLFGHVDVGCLHVRPALNLRDPEDEARFTRISDQVAQLVKSYGGVIWGEHGKGIRSAYSPMFFGDLYPTLQEVKALFDPRNQLNPGKLATPLGSQEALMELKSPLRAHQDRHIQDEASEHFASTINCNGNGQCFDYHPDHMMCPSAKVTQDRLHSPKGRAGVMRAWLRALHETKHTLSPDELNPFLTPSDLSTPPLSSLTAPLSSLTAPLSSLTALPARIKEVIKSWITKKINRAHQDTDFSSQVYEAMSGCLSCKACTTHCPVKVDVPQFKSRFLYLYYQRYPRPLRDLLIGFLEKGAQLGSSLPRFSNLLIQNKISVKLNTHLFQLIDVPALSVPSALTRLTTLNAPIASQQTLRSLSTELRLKAISLIPDAFNVFFDEETFTNAYLTLKSFGFHPMIAPFTPNGKGLYVKGRLKDFQRCVRKHLALLAPMIDEGVPMMAIDPAVALTYRDEYPEALNIAQLPFKVWLPQEWLVTQLHHLPKQLFKDRSVPLRLFAHCTERSLLPTAVDDWRKIFHHLGLALEVAIVGCCGMCGVYGHEREHEQESKELYALSWRPQVQASLHSDEELMITGYSCRAQIKRCGDGVQPHPLTWISKHRLSH